MKELKLESKKGAIAVNKYMQTSMPHIYAGGDCASEGMQLTPVAVHQGQVAAANILKAGNTVTDYTGISSAVFTIPVLASVGINAPINSKKYKVIFQDRSNWNNPKGRSEIFGFKSDHRRIKRPASRRSYPGSKR